MKFDYCIGNPPYQKIDGGFGAADAGSPVYNDFFNAAKQICKVEEMIFPSKWMVGGRGLDSFRQSIKEDKSIKKIVDYANAGDVFDKVHIDGGVCIVLRDNEYTGNVDYTYYTSDGLKLQSKRDFNNEKSNYIVRDSRKETILNKCIKQKQFSCIVSARKPYGIDTFLFNEPERFPSAMLNDKPFKDSYHIYGIKGKKGGAKRVDGYVHKDIVLNNVESISKYKIFMGKSYSTDAINPPKRILAEPNEICTETFLMIGPFDTKEEQINCETYMNTTFFKFLLHAGHGTMNVSSAVFCYTPLQNFTSNSDIDWNKSISDIDKQLYKKYGLSKEEIDFIENTIKEMN